MTFELNEDRILLSTLREHVKTPTAFRNVPSKSLPPVSAVYDKIRNDEFRTKYRNKKMMAQKNASERTQRLNDEITALLSSSDDDEDANNNSDEEDIDNILPSRHVSIVQHRASIVEQRYELAHLVTAAQKRDLQTLKSMNVPSPKKERPQTPIQRCVTVVGDHKTWKKAQRTMLLSRHPDEKRQYEKRAQTSHSHTKSMDTTFQSESIISAVKGVKTKKKELIKKKREHDFIFERLFSDAENVRSRLSALNSSYSQRKALTLHNTNEYWDEYARKYQYASSKSKPIDPFTKKKRVPKLSIRRGITGAYETVLNEEDSDENESTVLQPQVEEYLSPRNLLAKYRESLDTTKQFVNAITQQQQKKHGTSSVDVRSKPEKVITLPNNNNAQSALAFRPGMKVTKSGQYHLLQLHASIFVRGIFPFLLPVDLCASLSPVCFLLNKLASKDKIWKLYYTLRFGEPQPKDMLTWKMMYMKRCEELFSWKRGKNTTALIQHSFLKGNIITAFKCCRNYICTAQRSNAQTTVSVWDMNYDDRVFTVCNDDRIVDFLEVFPFAMSNKRNGMHFAIF